MFQFDAKWIFVAVLFAVLIAVKALAGGRPNDRPVRRRRRFGYRGSLSPLNQPGAREKPLPPLPEKPEDPEGDFFKGN